MQGKKLPLDLSNLKIGDTLKGNNAPLVAGKPLQIDCQVTMQARNGVILAHGGTTAGYALHLRDGKMVFVISDKNEKHEVELAFKPSDQPQTVRAKLAKDGELSLQIEDQIAKAKGLGLLSRQPKENFCVGIDDGQPVAQYSDSTRFAGKIEQLKISEP